MQAPEDRDHDPLEHDQRNDGDHRREVDRACRERQQTPPQAQVRIANVVKEALHRPQRVGQLHPRRDDVREDRQDVNAHEDVHEQLDLGDGVEHHGRSLRVHGCFSYAWLKKPPRSSNAARCSADTSTLRGVRRKTLSATRCMPPFNAYVRPLAKSISRFDSSVSALCRLRITGIPCLYRSAICCASLKLRGRTRCTLTLPALGTASICGRMSRTRSRSRSRSRSTRDGRTAGGRAVGWSDSDSVQSSKSWLRRRGVSRLTFGRS